MGGGCLVLGESSKSEKAFLVPVEGVPRNKEQETSRNSGLSQVGWSCGKHSWRLRRSESSKHRQVNDGKLQGITEYGLDVPMEKKKTLTKMKPFFSIFDDSI